MSYTTFRGSLTGRKNISNGRCIEEWHIWFKPNSCTLHVELFGFFEVIQWKRVLSAELVASV